VTKAKRPAVAGQNCRDHDQEKIRPKRENEGARRHHRRTPAAGAANERKIRNAPIAAMVDEKKHGVFAQPSLE